MAQEDGTFGTPRYSLQFAFAQHTAGLQKQQLARLDRELTVQVTVKEVGAAGDGGGAGDVAERLGTVVVPISATPSPPPTAIKVVTRLPRSQHCWHLSKVGLTQALLGSAAYTVGGAGGVQILGECLGPQRPGPLADELAGSIGTRAVVEAYVLPPPGDGALIHLPQRFVVPGLSGLVASVEVGCAQRACEDVGARAWRAWLPTDGVGMMGGPAVPPNAPPRPPPTRSPAPTAPSTPPASTGGGSRPGRSAGCSAECCSNGCSGAGCRGGRGAAGSCASWGGGPGLPTRASAWGPTAAAVGAGAASPAFAWATPGVGGLPGRPGPRAQRHWPRSACRAVGGSQPGAAP